MTWFDEQWPVGKIPFGQAAKVFKALIAEHGEETVKAGWSAYCREMQRQPQFFSLAKFSTTVAEWIGRAGGSRTGSKVVDDLAQKGVFDGDGLDGWT